MFPNRESRSRTALRRYLEAGQRPTLREDLDHRLAYIITACWEKESRYEEGIPRLEVHHRRPTADELATYLSQLDIYHNV